MKPTAFALALSSSSSRIPPPDAPHLARGSRVRRPRRASRRSSGPLGRPSAILGRKAVGTMLFSEARKRISHNLAEHDIGTDHLTQSRNFEQQLLNTLQLQPGFDTRHLARTPPAFTTSVSAMPDPPDMHLTKRGQVQHGRPSAGKRQVGGFLSTGEPARHSPARLSVRHT